MKKKLLILSASIGLLLACFPFILCAEEDPESNLGVSPPPAYYQLDEYFYENYTLLPYIESDGHQYIDTGVKYNSENMDFTLIGSNFQLVNDKYLLGTFNSSSNRFAILYSLNQFYDGDIRFMFLNNTGVTRDVYVSDYTYFKFEFKDNDYYFNDEELNVVSSGYFVGTYNLYLFGLNNAGNVNNGNLSSYRLYNFYIYDHSINDGDGGYIRYYYPARSISSGTIGLYDAISKTFVTTATATPFDSPEGSDAELSIMARVNAFTLSSLSWIGSILAFAIEEPIIILFMAIGLAGAMFRWGRRLVHF